jgi:hypothetical protein
MGTVGVKVKVGGGVSVGSGVCVGASVGGGCVADGGISKVGVSVTGTLDGRLQACSTSARINMNINILGFITAPSLFHFILPKHHTTGNRPFGFCFFLF